MGHLPNMDVAVTQPRSSLPPITTTQLECQHATTTIRDDERRGLEPSVCFLPCFLVFFTNYLFQVISYN